jgi:hypothetical protein
MASTSTIKRHDHDGADDDSKCMREYCQADPPLTSSVRVQRTRTMIPKNKQKGMGGVTPSGGPPKGPALSREINNPTVSLFTSVSQ